MLHLKLTPRSIRRLCVTMALIAPIIYLFGTMFTYLNGAHGDIVLAEPVYTEEYVQVDNAVDGGSYRFHVTDISNLVPNVTPSFYFEHSFVYNGASYDRIGFGSSSGAVYVSAPYTNIGFVPSSSVNWTFYFDGYAPFDTFFVGTLEKVVRVPTSVVPENNSANTDFLFGQMFPKDNFVSKIGADAISETPHGFAPFGALFRWLDLNVLDIGETQVGLMAYGYLYWCAHVLVFDLVFMCATFFITFVDSCFTKFNRSE